MKIIVKSKKDLYEDCKNICENTEKFEENFIQNFEKIVGPL